jgi:YidC/Oxa1 family membrane protein insertase
MMDEKQRTTLALALSALILVAWLFMMDYLKVGQKGSPTEPGRKEVSGPTVTGGQSAAPGGGSQEALESVRIYGPSEPGVDRDIVVDTPLYTASFTTRGARLTSFRLKRYPVSMDRKSPPTEMIRTPMPELVLEGLGSDRDLRYDTTSEGRVSLAAGGRAIEFTRRLAQGVTLKKTFVIDCASYLMGFNSEIVNTGRSPVRFSGSLTFDGLYPIGQKIKGYAFQGPVLLKDSRLEEFKLDKIKKPGAYRDFAGAINWFGLEDKYFLHALILPKAPRTTLTIRRLDENVVELSCMLPTLIVKPATSVRLEHLMFIGPKELNTLKAAGHNLAKALDFGFFDFIAKPLLVAMNWINRYTLSYGISIIVLTVIIKFLLYPLTLKSFKSMKELQKIQPLMKEIQNQYKDDKQKMNQELMRLYQEHKINPMGGCLPMLLQIPILFALYRVFYQAIELRHTPFHIVGTWLPDLSDKDPYYITPILMGLSQFALQKMTPAAGDPTQQKVMLMMPVIFTFLFLNFPSGLVIYWLVSNLLSIVQQVYINRKHV